MSNFQFFSIVKFVIILTKTVINCNANSISWLGGDLIHDSEIFKLNEIKVFSPTDALHYLVSVTKNGSINIWDLNERKIKYKFDESNGSHTKSINYLASLVLFENSYLATASVDCTIKLWDLNKRKLIFNFDKTNGGHNQSVEILQFFDSGILASGSMDGTVKLWDVRKGSLKNTFILSDNDYSRILIKLENFGYLISGSNKGVIKIWNITSLKEVYTFDKTQNGHNSIISSLIIMKNGYLTSGSYDGVIKIWDLINWKLKYTFDKFNNGHIDLIKSLCSIGNNLLASGSRDGTVKLWDMNNGQLKYSFNHNIVNKKMSIEKLIQINENNIVIGLSLIDLNFQTVQIKIFDIINRNITNTLNFSGNGFFSDLIKRKNGVFALGIGISIRSFKMNIFT